MDEPDHGRSGPPAPALSFAAVADAYDRARPTYPTEAVDWLVPGAAREVLEVGAGTGKLTEVLLTQGHRVLATDPLAPMLRHLVRRAPGAGVAVAAAERIPLRARAVDTVVAAQSFHWFDLDRALPEIARVLRPGGHLSLTWNLRDERVPWVRRLGGLIGQSDQHGQQSDPTHALLASNLFGFVESTRFRFWQRLDRSRLRDLVMSRSNVAVLPTHEQQSLLVDVDGLYDEYGRGADGMLLPYVTHCYRAVVRPPAVEVEHEPDRTDDGGDADALLIDFT